MKSILFAGVLLLAGMGSRAQDSTGSRALTMEEYEKAKTFSVADPDKDTYVKFENAYILDHSGFGKPYFITGDDGKKKRAADESAARSVLRVLPRTRTAG